MIIQGEGKGHFSQAMEGVRQLRGCGGEVTRCYLGTSLFRKTPAFFREESGTPVKRFLSPNFLRSPDRKGILVMGSVLLNLILSPIYFFEICRLGIMLKRDRSNRILNFYDPVGGLASRWFRRRAEKVVLSHHFYLSHPDFIHPHGMEGSYFWLQVMNRVMMRTADRVLALSFRPGRRSGRIEVIPPLVGSDARTIQHTPGKRDLCYFLNRGYATEMLECYGNSGEQADIFAGDGIADQKVPGVEVYRPSREVFLEKMRHCRRVITTGGFDTVAEAMYAGIPVLLVPAENHYEQYCNVLDAVRTGMAFQLESAGEALGTEFEPAGNEKYREWVNSLDFCRTIWLS